MKTIIIFITVFFFCITLLAQKSHFNDQLFENSNYNFVETIFKKNEKLTSSLMTSVYYTPNSLTGLSSENNSWQSDLKPNLKTRTLISAALFASTFATGYLLSNSNGHPNTSLLTVHKISAGLNLFILDATAFQKMKSGSLSTLETISAVTMNLSFISTIVTGALQSTGNSVPAWMNTSHKITPWISILTSGILFFLFNN